MTIATKLFKEPALLKEVCQKLMKLHESDKSAHGQDKQCRAGCMPMDFACSKGAMF